MEWLVYGVGSVRDYSGEFMTIQTGSCVECNVRTECSWPIGSNAEGKVPGSWVLPHVKVDERKRMSSEIVVVLMRRKRLAPL